MDITFVTTELAPFVKVGGLADVSAALPKALRGLGHSVTVVVPRFPAFEAQGLLLAGSDDGIGVAEGDLPRLFERFWRADAARTTRGTGLGLAIVKHVVAAAGGDIEADGGPGRGLRIRCTFPA